MFATVCRRFSKAHTSTKALGAQSLFLPAITTTRTPLMECDSNGHKSNSSYLTDLDISRSNLCNLLFGKALKMGPGPMSGPYFLALGGVACTFKREIMPYQQYQVCSRLLSWDEKWLYIVSHFFDTQSCPVQQGTRSAKRNSRNKEFTERKEQSRDYAKPEDLKKQTLFASAISRSVFKEGRITVPPEVALRSFGLLPRLSPDMCSTNILNSETAAESKKAIPGQEQSACSGQVDRNLESWETIRLRNLSIARLEDGWDQVHALFYSSDEMPITTYLDIPHW